MSEYEGKWPDCLAPETYRLHPSCKYMGWQDYACLCMAGPDEGCLENKARSKEHYDCSKKDYNPQPKLIEIELPGTIKVGGFDYEVTCSKERDAELERNNQSGVAYHSDTKRDISIKTTLSPQNFNNTTIHEFVHVADTVNNSNSRLTETQVEGIANGLHQIFEQLNIRFVVKQ